MAYNSLPKFGLAIDWETSGYSTPSYAEKHQGLSFGAIVFDAKSLDPIEHIYREIQFDQSKYLWDEGAEKVHGLSREYLRANGVTQEQAALDLGNLIIKYFGTEDVPLLGHRVYFDKAFNDQLLSSIGVNVNWHPLMFDSASTGAFFLETTKSDEIFDLLGLPPRGAHNSLEDITYTLAVMKRMKEIFMAGLVAEL
jgi:hypothetical protein